MRIEQVTDTADREDYVLLFDAGELATRNVDGHDAYAPTTVIVSLVPDDDGVWTDACVKLLGAGETGREVTEYVTQWGDLPAVVREWLSATLQDRNDNR